MGENKMKRITLKEVIKQLAEAKITGKDLKYDYYCYNNHSYNQITQFDLLTDRFQCVGGHWEYFDCKNQNLRLYYKLKETHDI